MTNKTNTWLNDFSLFLDEFYGGYNIETDKFEKFELYPFQEAIIKKFDEREVFIMKSRQMHLTTLVSFYIVWKMLTKKNYSVLLFSHNLNGGIHLLRGIKDILSIMNGPVHFKVVKNNEKYLELENFSSIQVCVNENSLVGKNVELIVFDEASYSKHFEDVYKMHNIYCTQFIAYSSVQHNDFFYKLAKEKGIQVHWTQHPVYSKGYDHKNYETSEWYKSIMKCLNNEKMMNAEYNMMPIEKEQKDVLINFRISKDLENKLTEKINKINKKNSNKINLSTYLRILIENDLSN